MPLYRGSRRLILRRRPVVVAAGAATAFVTPANTGTWTFSNSNKTVLCTATANIGGQETGMVLTNNALSGLKAFIIGIDALPSNYGAIGVSDGANQGAPGFSGAGSFGIFSAAAGIWVNSSNVGTSGVSFSAPSGFVGLYVDATNKLAWASSDGTNFYGGTGAAKTAADVAAGTDGFSFGSAISGSTFYAAGGALTATAQGYTIQTANPGGWTMPSGYSVF